MPLPLISCEQHFQRAVESLLASPIGLRLKLTEEKARSIVFQPSIVLALTSYFAPETSKPHVRLVNLPIHGVEDDGFWLDPKSLGLTPFASLELVEINRERRQSIYGKSPHAISIASYSKPRLRTATQAQLAERARRSTVLICFEEDFIDPTSDITWLKGLKPSQFILLGLDPRKNLKSVIKLANAGAILREHIVLCQQGTDPFPLCATVIVGFKEPLESPIPLPSNNPHSGNYASLHLAPDPSGLYASPRLHISESHIIDESGLVTLKGTSEAGPSFSLGAIEKRLPEIARLANAVASSNPTSQIQVNGKSVPLPPLYADVSLQDVAKTVAEHTRKRRTDRLKPPRYPHGRSLLSVAILKGAPTDVIADLLNIGLDPDEADDYGWTPVIYAASLGLAKQALELLVTGIPDLEQSVIDGVTVADVLDYYGFSRDDSASDNSESKDEEQTEHKDSDASFTSASGPAPNPSLTGPIGLADSATIAHQTPPLEYPSPLDSPNLKTPIPRHPLAESLSAILRNARTSDSGKRISDASEDLEARNQIAKPIALTPNQEATEGGSETVESSSFEPVKVARQLTEVVPIYASVLDFPSKISPTAIRGKIMDWLRKASSELRNLDPILPRFDSDRFSVLSDEDPASGLFALRFDNHVPNSFTYRTELVVYPSEEKTIVSTRLQAIRPPGNEDDAEPSVPRIASAFADLGARHLRLPVGRVLPVVTEADSELFASLVFDPHRVLPILAVYGESEHLIHELPAQIRAAVLIIHVYPRANASVQRRIGRDFIGYRGAWRIYPPGLKPESSRYDAPLILDPTAIPSGRLSYQIRHTIWRFSRVLTEDDAPTYLTVRQLILHRQRDAQSRIDSLRSESTVGENAALYEVAEVAPKSSDETRKSAAEQVQATEIAPEPPKEEIEALTSRVAHLIASVGELSARVDQITREHRIELQAAMDEARLWKDLAEETEAKVSSLISERNAARRDVFDLKSRLAILSSGAQDEEDERTEVDYPASFESLEDWVESRYEGRIYITKKALKAARSVRSEPYIVRKAYEAIDLLANEYINAKAGDSQARERLTDRQKATQLEVTKVGEAIKNHRYADEYFASVGGVRLRLDMHVREFGGTDFNPERQLRIYFNHDESNGRVVIGHLPTHLTSSHP